MDNMLNAEIWSIAKTDQGNAVLLRPTGMDCSVPIFIGQLEAQSLLLGFQEIPIIRPLAHDLLINILKSLSVKLARLEIHELKNNTFYGRLILTGGDFTENKPLVMDCRPSDGLSLAVRSGCPVLISETVVKQAGIAIETFTDITEETIIVDKAAGEIQEEPQFIPTTEFERIPGSVLDFEKSIRRNKLKAELDMLVAAEEYERAAEVRDIISMLDKEDEDVP